MKKTKKAFATLISISLISSQLLIPLALHADDIPTDTSANTTTAQQSSSTDSSGGSSAPQTSATDSSATSSSSSTDSQTATADASTTASSESSTTTAATSNNDLSLHASSTGPLSGIIETIQNIASSSNAGFVPSIGANASTSNSSPGSSGGGNSIDVILGSSTPPTNTNSNATSTGATVISGIAIALANILNLLNATFLNSSGSIIFSNYINPAGTIDLRNSAEFAGLCGGQPCQDHQGVTLNLNQDGHLNNDIVVNAASGQNQVSTTTDGLIKTGDAYAGLNLVNLSNVTFANTNYLLVTLNAFRGVQGDIIFPTLAHFFEALASSTAPASSLNNQATVTNDVGTGAQSGDNTIASSSNAVITSGNAKSYANVYNQVNSVLANTGLSIMFRISGKWTGQIFGAPQDVNVIWNPDGTLYLLGKATDTPQSITNGLITGTTTSDIGNQVRVNAITGENGISDASSSALISTGNALAGANIINIANQTVMGRNWILAIINIFGDFNGNISFGRPDLWVGDQVGAPSYIQNDTDLTYTITVKNKGDADASHVKLTETPDLAHLDILDSSSPFTSNAHSIVFDLGNIPAGGSAAVVYHARVKNTQPGTGITNTSSATLFEPDNNTADNTDTATVQASTPSGGGSGGGSSPIVFFNAAKGGSVGAHAQANVPVSLAKTNLVVNRKNQNATATRENPTVAESVIVQNNSLFTAKNVVLRDIIRDPSGKIIHTEYFDLGDVNAGDEVDIDYNFVFGAQAPAGTYSIESEYVGDNVGQSLAASGTLTLVTPTIPALVTIPTKNSSNHATVVHRSAKKSLKKNGKTLPRIPNTGSNAKKANTIKQAMPAAAGSASQAENYNKFLHFFMTVASKLVAQK